MIICAATRALVFNNVAHTPALKPHRAEKVQQDHEHVIKVPSSGNFTDRVAAFNTFLSSFRAAELNRRGPETWKRPISTQMQVLTSKQKGYQQLLSNYSKVTTFVLPWLTNRPGFPVQNSSNMLIQTYYDWTADDRLCSLIETRANLSKFRNLANWQFGMSNRNINNTARPSSLQMSHSDAKYVYYMHIHRDAVVTKGGNVITDNLQLVLYGCLPNIKPSLLSHVENTRIFDEVFVLSQGIWGRGIFHRMVEIVPKVALLVDFLNASPQIPIAAPQGGGRLAQLLTIIGLKKPRLVTGVIRAKTVYQPRATRCGVANIQESQMLSQLYRDYIERTFPVQPRNRLILIRRSRHRRFSEHRSIAEALQLVAKDYRLTFALFADNPTPSLNDTMTMFHSAVVVSSV